MSERRSLEDGSAWIEWTGGESPVSAEVKVDTKFRRGNQVEGMESGFWRWDHSRSSDRRERPSDIVAYRISGAAA